MMTVLSDFNSRRLELDRAREALKESERKTDFSRLVVATSSLAAKAELERSEASLLTPVPA